MKKLVALAAAAVLSGCAAMGAHTENNALGMMTNLCEKGDVDYCKRRAMYQVKAGVRTRSEASQEFLPACMRAASRVRNSNALDCTGFAEYLLTYKPPTFGY